MMRDLIVGRLAVVVKLADAEAGGELVRVGAVRALTGPLLHEYLAHQIAAAMGTRWENDPREGATYALLFQVPAGPKEDKT